jgi:hypothetical protein
VAEKTSRRLSHYKSLLRVRGLIDGGMLDFFRDGSLEDPDPGLTKRAFHLYLKDNCECDPKSLENAAKFFGLDLTRELDCDILIRVLAAVLFPTKRRGRAKGSNKYWTDYRLCLLGRKDRELRAANPGYNDTEIAKVISEDAEFKAFRKDPDPIRKRLPAGRKSLQWLDQFLAKGSRKRLSL